VLTAPSPTSRIPSFPPATSIFGGFFTTGNYIISGSCDRNARSGRTLRHGRERSGASDNARAERSEPGGVQGTPPI
jgi:hypothetical protein